MKHFAPRALLSLLVLASAFAAPSAVTAPPSPSFDGKDAKRGRVVVSLQSIAGGLKQPTDIQFPPGTPGVAYVTEQPGTLKRIDIASGRSTVALKVQVHLGYELGLLGVAFHPAFPRERKAYLNYNPAQRETVRGGGDFTRISEWKVDADGKLSGERVLLEIDQPYVNHNGGQLQFGPDGMLYIGMGDGGSAGDPRGYGQKKNTLLGKMLRIDVKPSGGKPYTVPGDNPFVGKAEWSPEIWATGLRNPWRFSFDKRGLLIAGDVGQDKWEEISVLERGKNYGWAVKEGFRCFRKETCADPALADPVLEYDHDEGYSVTGGYVYEGAAIPALQGLYVFADFGSARMWAARIEGAGKRVPEGELKTLGRWPFAISTFGRDAGGELYVADYTGGNVYKLKASN